MGGDLVNEQQIVILQLKSLDYRGMLEALDNVFLECCANYNI